MTILAVDSSADKLASMKLTLQQTFPNDLIIAHCDPLAAGKYSYSYPVDLLFAAMEMQRMDGWQLSAFVHRTNPGALIFLITRPELDMESILWKDNVNGFLSWPLTQAAVLSAVRAAQEN